MKSLKKIIPFNYPTATNLIGEYLKEHIKENLVIVCIGTDKFIGDALGPIVGSILKFNNFPYPVYGTLHEPIHALNLNKFLSSINEKHQSSYIIAIDACLGTNVGDICIRDHPIYPGKGVGKILKEVGDISIVGIVSKGDSNNFLTSNSIRLSFIYDLACIIAKGILNAYNYNLSDILIKELYSDDI
ncbi:spore protease YyaC [Clostridium thermobutyricum]|uniref:spore protease YyaC n=1 Tax=Clostridium thermobutyricum TaxID=29372 RepID=UPI003BF9EB02